MYLTFASNIFSSQIFIRLLEYQFQQLRAMKEILLKSLIKYKTFKINSKLWVESYKIRDRKFFLLLG